MAQKPALIASLGLLVGSGALALWALSPGGAPPPPGAGPAAGTSSAAAPAGAMDGDASAPPAAGVAEAIADDEGRVAVTAETGAPGPVLRIVQRDTGAALPGAEVFTVSAARFSTRTRDGLHWSERVIKDGQRWQADAQGRVALPPLDNNGIYVTARAEGLYGARRLRTRNGATPTLTLDTDETLVVRLRSMSGEPAPGLSIALCTGMVKRLDHRIALPTNDDGIATFQHVQMHRVRNREKKKGGPAHADFVAVAAVLQQEPVLARVPAAAIPKTPVDLWLGAVGALTVRVCGPDGEPLLTPCQVRFMQVRPNPLPAGMTKEFVDKLRVQCALQADKLLGESSVRFDAIGAGLTFAATVRFADSDFNFGVGKLAGPVGREERQIELRMPGKFSLLTGRLVLPDGRAAAGLQAQMLLNGYRGQIEGERISTTEDGRFELPLEIAKPQAPYALEVQATTGDERIGHLMALPGLRQAQRLDIGDVQLRALPVLAHGAVRDDAGVPIAGAYVELQTFRAAAGAGGEWRGDSYASTIKSDENGVFRMYGEPRPLRMRLRARAGGHTTTASPEITAGMRVELALERLGGLTAKGVMPDWVPRGALRYRLISNGVKIRERDLRKRRNGEFLLRLGGLRSGTYDLAFELRGIPRPVMLVAGLRVEPGVTASDARLQNLDLRGSAFRYVVHAVDAAGKRISPSSPLLARVTGSDGRLRDVGFRWKGGRVEFYTTDPTVAVVALASGYRPREAQLTAGESKLALNTIQPVRVHLPGLRQLIGPDTRVRISLVYDGDTGLPMKDFRALDQRNGKTRGYARASMGKSGGGWLDARDKATVRLMLDGRYQVVARLSHPKTRGTASRVLGTIDVTLGGTTPHTATLQPPADIVDRAVAELRAEIERLLAQPQRR